MFNSHLEHLKANILLELPLLSTEGREYGFRSKLCATSRGTKVDGDSTKGHRSGVTEREPSKEAAQVV